MIRRLIQTTAAVVILAASSLPASALHSKPDASTSAYTQPSIVDVFSFEGAYHCGGSCAPDGTGSSNSLMLASDGNFYGATVAGGTLMNGVLFKLTPDGNYTDIHNFGFTPDGATVVTSLMEASDGNLYGVTDSGGANYRGTIFQYNLSRGVFTTVYNFAIGGGSYSQLIDDGKGHLYGSTSYDGLNGLGNIFSWNYETNSYTDIYDFKNGVDGQHPWAGIIVASDGRIYGTSRFGGPTDHTGTGFGDGVAWSVDVQGTDFKVIHNFGSSATDGYSPVQGFVEGSDHSLYSTTLYGGRDCSANDNSNGCGTLYKITPNGTDPTYTQIYALSLSAGQGVNPQHGSPTLGGDGKLYVVGPQGGPTGYGQLMAFTTAGVYTDVHDFAAVGASDTSGTPAAAVLEDQLGNLWGGTITGAENQNGDIFKIEAGIVPAMTLTASTTAPDEDQKVQLTWKATNAFSDSAKICFATSSDGSFTGITSIAGSATVAPAKSGTITYALTCGGSQTATATVDVLAKIVTTTTITSAPSTLVYGQAGTIEVSVVSPSGEVSGSAALIVGGQTIATAGVINGVAQIHFATAKLATGNYSFQIKYEGDQKYGASISEVAKIAVTKVTPEIKFTLSPNKLVDGEPATLLVSVTNGANTPGGSVVFSISGETLASTVLTSGSAIVSIDTSKYLPGSYVVSATYKGDVDDTVASATQTMTIAKDSTITTLGVASAVVEGNQLVATVAVTKPNMTGTPTGTVQLLRNGKVIATATVSNGKAVIESSTAGVSAGSYSFSAVYLGDTQNAASSSPNESVTVTQK
ncbi:choice-of-anchor tandem repeat GloVer-containing protein [Granulicella sp. S190]|uniref:choice-of-anchor tandem repeat GloVer-containing protein n=1 Tax=Granulicella sp. S190 TaxID=1747226 RepID=UPI00131BE9FF|nr:choice-of-anchor tandem repeat GloVer-containing protein [Granulicella sp. S190]